MNKQDEITITFTGPAKFRQAFVDSIYKLLTAEDFIEEATKPGCGFTFNSSIEPSEELQE